LPEISRYIWEDEKRNRMSRYARNDMQFIEREIFTTKTQRGRAATKMTESVSWCKG
jgi:hypothetical protein